MDCSTGQKGQHNGQPSRSQHFNSFSLWRLGQHFQQVFRSWPRDYRSSCFIRSLLLQFPLLQHVLILMNRILRGVVGFILQALTPLEKLNVAHSARDYTISRAPAVQIRRSTQHTWLFFDRYVQRMGMGALV